MKTIKKFLFILKILIKKRFKPDEKVKRYFGVAKIYYVKQDIKDFSALSFTDIILIEVDDKNEKPLREHELDHVRQWFEERKLYISALWNKDAAKELELQAHTKEVKAGGSITRAAYNLSTNYNFEIDYNTALAELRKRTSVTLNAGF